MTQSQSKKIFCKKCTTPYLVTEDLIGRKVQCPGCKKKFILNSEYKLDDINSSIKTESSSKLVQIDAVYESSFAINDIIGEGGMGTVYRASQKKLNRSIAVKLMLGDAKQKDNERVNDFLQEAKITANLNHPNIVPIYDLGTSPTGELFYTMKEIEGNVWQDEISKKNETENLNILLKVCDAVAFAHSKGIIHCDIKPENVMLGDFGEVVLMDWGISVNIFDKPLINGLKHVNELDKISGSPAYMAPEVANMEISKIGVSSDIYLLGGTLYTVLTGETPHPSPDSESALEEARTNTIKKINKHTELVDVAFKALEEDASKRFKSVKEFQEAINESIQHTESTKLVEFAVIDLKRGKDNDDYDAFAQSIFGFKEALKLWKDNSVIQKNLDDAIYQYAQCAFYKQNYDLALSLLPENEENTNFINDIKREIKLRDQAYKRNKIMKIAGGILIVFFITSLLIAFLFVKDAQKKTDEALVRANAALNRAEVSEKQANTEKENAIESKNIANQERQKAIDATKKIVEALEKVEKSKELEAKAYGNAIESKLTAEKAMNEAKIALEKMQVAKIKAQKANEELLKKDISDKKRFKENRKRQYVLLLSISKCILNQNYKSAYSQLLISSEKDKWNELKAIIKALDEFENIVLNNASKNIGKSFSLKYQNEYKMTTLKRVKDKQLYYAVSTNKGYILRKKTVKDLTYEEKRVYFSNIDNLVIEIYERRLENLKDIKTLSKYFINEFDELNDLGFFMNNKNR